jgi:hypothetical protein
MHKQIYIKFNNVEGMITVTRMLQEAFLNEYAYVEIIWKGEE